MPKRRRRTDSDSPWTTDAAFRGPLRRWCDDYAAAASDPDFMTQLDDVEAEWSETVGDGFAHEL